MKTYERVLYFLHKVTEDFHSIAKHLNQRAKNPKFEIWGSTKYSYHE